MLLFVAFIILMGLSDPAAALTVLTQNMAEISDADSRRIDGLLLRLDQEAPDLLLLQEAEEKTLERINSIPRFNQYKAIFQRTKRGPSGGLVILVRRSLTISNATYTPLPSEMGRGLLMTTVNVCGKALTIVNIHLESPDLLIWRNREFRHQQIELLKVALNHRGSFIVAGDFNLVFDDEAERMIPATWSDAWRATFPAEQGLTWDPSTNERAWHEGGFILPGFRLDRVLFSADEIQQESVRMIGRDETMKLSDHYGLAVRFTCAGGPRTAQSLKMEGSYR